jgi:hypothetical protein
MEDLSLKHLRDIYGLNPDIPHIALQFPRIPPSLSNYPFKSFENPIKEKFFQENASINKKLKGFQQFYHKYALGLLNTNSGQIIPPGHPLFSQCNSDTMLKVENDKLQKENLELRKKIDQQESTHKKNWF